MSSTPTVLLDNFESNNPCVASIGTDSTSSLLSAINHLTELGHQKIALLNGDFNSYISERRTLAFKSACQSNEIIVNDDAIRYGDYSIQCATLYVEAFLEMGTTAIICCSDLMAMGVITECIRLGKRVPEDISVIGFDDVPIAAHLSPPLTTIRQDRNNLGRLAFSTLQLLLNNIPIGRTLLRPELVIRDSTAKIQNKNSK